MLAHRRWSPPNMARVHTILPLGLLLSLQEADQLPDLAGEPFGDLASVRFGGSTTVAAQITRYRELLGRGSDVDSAEVAGLIRLVARRPDADLVLADAGRTAGRLAAERSGMGMAVRAVSPRRVKRWSGRRKLRRVCADVFGVTFDGDDAATWADPAELGTGDLAGSTCRLIGSATAELVRTYTGFEGALFHTTCRARNHEVCSWAPEPSQGD